MLKQADNLWMHSKACYIEGFRISSQTIVHNIILLCIWIPMYIMYIGGLQTVIDYSRFDSDPGSHNITVLAVSTTEQQVRFEYAFNVSGKHLICCYDLSILIFACKKCHYTSTVIPQVIIIFTFLWLWDNYGVICFNCHPMPGGSR